MLRFISAISKILIIFALAEPSLLGYLLQYALGSTLRVAPRKATQQPLCGRRICTLFATSDRHKLPVFRSTKKLS